MSRPLPVLILLLGALALWLAAAYGLRLALMEDDRWVGHCALAASDWACRLRAALGLLIHFRVLAWGALLAALLGCCLAGRGGRLLAGLALFLGVPALVLYNASLAVFALVLGGLRLVRQARA